MATKEELLVPFANDAYPDYADFSGLVSFLDQNNNLSGAGNPTDSNIPVGKYGLWKNTSTGETRLWSNLGSGNWLFSAALTAPWAPSDLYAASNGAFLDLTTSSLLYQADQVSLVTTSGQLIGKATDISGKGNHFLATSGNEPSYIIASGKGYCNFPGGKWLEKLITKPTSYTTITALRGAQGYVAGSASSGASASTAWGQLEIDASNKYSWAFGDGSAYAYGKSDAAMFSNGVDAIVVQTYTAGATKPVLMLNNTTPVANSVGAGTAVALGGTNYKQSIGRLGEYASTWTGRMYGRMIIDRVLNSTEIGNVLAYFTARMP